MRGWSVTVAVLVAALLLAAGTGTSGPAPVRGGTLTIALASDPVSLDPHRTPSVGLVHRLMYETLVTVDRRTGEFVPALA